MYTNPHIGGDRQRDMRANAEQQRRAQQQPGQHLGWALRTLARLRLVIPRAGRQVSQAEAVGGSRPQA
jgi:hypothetical protein